MRTFEEIMKQPHVRLTKEEWNNFGQIILGGRTDGRPHEEFEYDPKTGEEVPPCDSEQIMAMSRSKDEKTRDRGIELRWELFQQRCRDHVNEMCENMDSYLGFD